jgi:hypothetical protein
VRSAAEIAFRLRQETQNVRLWLRPPSHNCIPCVPLPGLPDPDAVASRLRGTAHATEVIGIASEILEGRIPLFGQVLETGEEIDWRRDWMHGKSTGLAYFRRIPYLDFERAGDHKVVWELNRHQHLVLLAQAWRLSGDKRYPAAIERHMQSWLVANPFQRGINWTSALEVAFRALSWIWTWHLAGDAIGRETATRWIGSLYQHGLHIENNLSIYFSPNTHLLGEAVVLHALGVLFPNFTKSQRWRTRGAELVREQMKRQVRADGSHFEQSTYYHVYALDLFLLFALLEPAESEFRERLWRMAEFLGAVMGESRRLPELGDSDGGRMFHPYGDRATFGRASLALAACVCGNTTSWRWDPCDVPEMAAWYLGADTLDRVPAPVANRESRLFTDSGVAVMSSGDVQVLVDAGPFGAGSGGHSHSDTLSVIVRRGSADLLRDAGTFQYMGRDGWRDWFRGSAAHNTVRVDEVDQATPRGPFAWMEPPVVKVNEWQTADRLDYLDAVCRFRLGAGECAHRRRVAFFKPHLVAILDSVDGGAGTHLVEQFWHSSVHASLHVMPEAVEEEGGKNGWFSPVYGTRLPAPVIRVSRTGTFPIQLAAVLDLDPGAGEPGALCLEHHPEGDVLVAGTRRVVFPPHGLPRLHADSTRTNHD